MLCCGNVNRSPDNNDCLKFMHSYSVRLIFAESFDNIEHEPTTGTGTENLLTEPMTSYIIYHWKLFLIIEKLYLLDRAINSSFGKYQLV